VAAQLAEVLGVAALPGSRGVLDDSLDLSIVVAEAYMVGTILLHSDGALKGSVTDSKGDALSCSLLDHLANLVSRIPCHDLTIDLLESTSVLRGGYTSRIHTLQEQVNEWTEYNVDRIYVAKWCQALMRRGTRVLRPYRGYTNPYRGYNINALRIKHTKPPLCDDTPMINLTPSHKSCTPLPPKYSPSESGPRI
jgi:hypothetical protein